MDTINSVRFTVTPNGNYGKYATIQALLVDLFRYEMVQHCNVIAKGRCKCFSHKNCQIGCLMIDSHRNTPLNSLEGLRVAKVTFLAGGRRFPGIY